MIDIRKALDAALESTGDIARKIGLIKFVERTAEKDLPLCQWRTVGGDSDPVERFLTELGFDGSEDYSIDVSALDPSVRTFRWGGADGEKYKALRTSIKSEGPATFTGMITRILTGKTGTDITEGLEGTFDPVSPTSVTVDGEDKPVDMLELHKITASRYAKYNAKVPEESRIAHGDEAVPDLSVIETICRTLWPTVIPDKFPVPVFSSPVGRTPQTRTVMRHFSNAEALPHINMFANTVVPAVHQLGEEDEPMRGYLYRTVETCEKINAVKAASVALFGCEEVKADARSVAEAVNTNALRGYVAALYSKFFGIDVSRIGIAPWSITAIPIYSPLTMGNNLSSDFHETWKKDENAVRTGLGIERTDSAIYKFTVVISRTPIRHLTWKSTAVLADAHQSPALVVNYQSDDGTVKEEREANEENGPVKADLAGEWFDYILRNQTPVYPYCSMSFAKRTLETKRRKWRASLPKASLAKLASFDDNETLRYDDGDGIGTRTPISSLMVDIGSEIRKASSNRTGSSIAPAFREGCPSGHLFSRVAVRITDEWQDELPDGKPVSDLVDDAVYNGRTRTASPDPFNSVYQLILETNISYKDLTLDAITALRPALIEAFVNRIVYGNDRDPGDSFHTYPHSPGDVSILCRYYNLDRGFFAFGVSYEDWFRTLGYNGAGRTRIIDPLGRLKGYERASKMTRLQVKADADGRLVLIFGMSGLLRNTAIAHFRVHSGVPVVDAVLVAPLVSGARPFVLDCTEDTVGSPETLASLYDFVMRNRDSTPPTGWTQSDAPFYGIGRLFCHQDSSGPDIPMVTGRSRYDYDRDTSVSLCPGSL